MAILPFRKQPSPVEPGRKITRLSPPGSATAVDGRLCLVCFDEEHNIIAWLIAPNLSQAREMALNCDETTLAAQLNVMIDPEPGEYDMGGGGWRMLVG